MADTLKLKVRVDTVEIHPLDTFQQRFAAALSTSAYNVAYVSQITFRAQQTLVGDVSAWGEALYDQDPNCWLVYDSSPCTHIHTLLAGNDSSPHKLPVFGRTRVQQSKE